jgi:hypothetical protein
MQICLSGAAEAHKHDNSSFCRGWDVMEGGKRPPASAGEVNMGLATTN